MPPLSLLVQNPLGALRRNICLLRGLTLCLWLLVVSPAIARPNATDELKKLAGALRQQWTTKSYTQLGQFALRNAGTQRGAQAEFVLGFADFERKRFAQAEKHLERARRGEALSDYAEYYLSLTLAEENRPAAAARLLEEFDSRHPTSVLAFDAFKRRADFLLRTGETRVALAQLEANPQTSKETSLLLLLARAQAATGERLEAAQTYQKIFYESPLSNEASAAGQELRALRGKLGAAYPRVPNERRFNRTDKLFEARRYSTAREEYKALAAELTGQQKEKAQVRLGASLYYLNRIKPALSYLKKLSPQDPDAAAERLLTIAQCHRRLDREEEMSAAIAQLARNYSSSPAYEEALFFAANYYFLQRDSRSAASFYQRLVERFPAGLYTARAHWKMAWLEYLDGNRTAAARLMEEHLARFPNTPHLPNALYWVGRLAEESRDTARARAYFGKLLERFPNGYWASRAEERWKALPASASPDAIPPSLGSIPPPAAIARVDAPLPGTAEEHLAQANLLEDLSLGDLALDALRQAFEKSEAPALLLRLARLAEDQGRYGLAFDFARRIAPEPSAYPAAAVPREVWEIAFPRPYWDVISREAEKTGLDPLLILALMRQESAFQVRAVSSQGAIGLMQVLPKTARRLSRDLRLRYGKTRLFDPDYNVRLGAYYLKKLFGEFSGNLASVLASYNAGEGRVRAWQGERAYRDAEEFVESIPLTETREYVQIVTRNYILYRRLYAEPAKPGQPGN